MNKIKRDVIILGGGTAGLAAYREAIKAGKTAIIVEAKRFGTTCASVGCMPSKLLIAAAENVHSFSKSKQFGIDIEGYKIDGKRIMERVNFERNRFVGFVMEGIEQIPQEDKLIGFAKFKDEHTILVDQDYEINANVIVIATGSRSVYPKQWEELGDLLVINDHIFDWKDLPKSVAVFGAGVIGIELGQALSYLGVNVKLFSIGGTIATLTDQDIINYAEKTFSEDFYFDINANVKSIEKDNNQVKITYINKDKEEKIEYFDYMLAATGRKPNVDNIGLENINIEKDEKGVPIANKYTMQTSIPNIFIAGDSSNQIPLLHEAADQGKIAGVNAGLYPQVQSGLRRAPLSIVFSNPQIAMVGENRRSIEKRLKCGCFEVGTVSFENQGRSRVMLVNKGKLNIYAEQGTGLFLGAEMIGPQAEHIAHLLSWSYQQKMTISQMLDMPFYHPVIEEGLRTALRDVDSKLKICHDRNQDCFDNGLGC